MNFDPQKIPQRDPELIWQTTADGIVIVSPSEGQVRVLNRLGMSIWRMIDGVKSLSEIESNLVASYGHQVETSRIRQDFYAFIDELIRREMVTWFSTNER